MTLHKIKESLVDKKQLMTTKELSKLVIKVGLATIGVCLDIGLLSVTFLNGAATALVVIGTILAFNWLFDLIEEDEKALKRVRFFGNIFFLFYLILIAETLLLKYFRFL